jgi:solute carrier family 25 ornithine transporter 2/15
MSTETNKNILNTRDVSRDIFSATIGSICCCYTGQPLDTLKVRMQTNPTVYKSIIQSTSKTIKEEGISALWKGAVPTAMGMAAENAMAFGVNEALKRAFPDDVEQTEGNGNGNDGNGGGGRRPDLMKPFAMGLITGCCSALVLLPSEVVKAKTQVAIGTAKKAAPSSTEIYNQMIKKQGFKSLCIGLDSQLARDGSFYAIFFGGYELLCYTFRTLVPSMPDELNYFLSGGFAGMLGWAVAMPFDVPKTNVQSRWDTKVVGSYFPQMITIAKERGLRGFYSGLGPTLLRAFPANAALFLGVETGKKFFDGLF